MTLNELLEDYKFLDLLDENDSKNTLKYIYDLRIDGQISQICVRDIGIMFKDLGIYPDICLDETTLSDRKKYIGPNALFNTKNKVLDLRGKFLTPESVIRPKEKCRIIIDDTTKIFNPLNTDPKQPIVVTTDAENEFVIESIPRENLFWFNVLFPEVKIRFKIKDDMADFKKYLHNQRWLFESTQLKNSNIIDQMLQNTEEI